MIRLENLTIAVGSFVIEDIDLEIHNGEYFVLLGPTGCGKTVLLECLAGIKKIDSGKIWIDDEDVTRWYPEERNIGYLPQDFALFPHMTVEQNIAFGLRARKRCKNEIRTTIDILCRPLNIGHLLIRYPAGLSGGEKQRVALARALAIKPKVMILDEPLSALDENTRERLCCELRNIHSIFGTAFIHVSHNFEETSQVADRIAVMNYGTIEQVGTVDDILRHPANRYVAGFTLTRNIFNGISIGTGHGSRVSLADNIQLYSASEVTGNVLVTIRPEYIQIMNDTYASTNEFDNIFGGKIMKILFKGSYISISVDIGVPITIYTTETSKYNKGKKRSQNDKITLRIPPDAVNIMVSNESEHE